MGFYQFFIRILIRTNEIIRKQKVPLNIFMISKPSLFNVHPHCFKRSSMPNVRVNLFPSLMKIERKGCIIDEVFGCCKILGVILTLICNNRYSWRSEEHTSELQSRFDLVCRLLLEKKKID